MDSRVHARFFRISPPEKGAPDFPDILKAIHDGTTAGQRERDIGDDVKVRLERLGEHGKFLEGELCRVQTANFPPHTNADGLKPMVVAAGGGLGHLAAFSYHIPTRTLLLQRNLQSVTVTRLALYLAATKADRLFHLRPLLASDAMARFAKKKPRGFLVTFAGPDDLEALVGANIPVAQAAKLLAEAYQGVRVKIEVSVGRSRKKSLFKQNIHDDLSALIYSESVKSLKVRAAGDDEDDLINFLKEQMQGEAVLTLPDDNVANNYTVRKNFLRTLFADNMAAVQK
jgi:hypothetical protein